MYPIVLSSEFVWQILIFTFWCSFLPQSQHTQVRQNSICEPTKIWSDENIFVQPSKVELTKLLSVSSFSAFEAFAALSFMQNQLAVCVSCHHVITPDVLLWHWPFPMSPDVSHDNLIPANTCLSSQILVNTPALEPSPLNTEEHKTHKSQTLTSLATDVSDDCFKHHLHP